MLTNQELSADLRYTGRLWSFIFWMALPIFFPSIFEKDLKIHIKIHYCKIKGKRPEGLKKREKSILCKSFFNMYKYICFWNKKAWNGWFWKKETNFGLDYKEYFRFHNWRVIGIETLPMTGNTLKCVTGIAWPPEHYKSNMQAQENQFTQIFHTNKTKTWILKQSSL